MKVKIGKRKYSLGHAFNRYVKGLFAAYLSKFLMPFLRKKAAKQIVFIGHTFSGNALAFAEWLTLNHPEYKISFASDDPKYYQNARAEFKEEYPNIDFLSLQKINDVLAVAKSTIVLSTHGPLTLLPWRNVKLPKRPVFIELWHGVGFKGQLPEGINDLYSRMFVSSANFKKLYQQHGLNKHKAVVTGYARSDRIINNTQSRKEILRQFSLPVTKRKILLFAPTWKTDGVNGFEKNNATIRKLQKIAVASNIMVIFRTHINNDFSVLAKASANFQVLPAADFPDTEKLLCITDILVTDWSSVYTDFMAKQKPVIFLDVPRDFDNKGLKPEDRAGYKVKTMDELVSLIPHVVKSSRDYHRKFGADLKRVKHLVWGNTLDGNSCRRYFKALKEFI